MRSRRFFAFAFALAAMSAASLLSTARATVPPDLAFMPSVLPPCENVGGLNCDRNSEPSIAVDPDGNLYLSSIVGVPGGQNLWKRAAGATTLQHLGVPDGLPIVTAEAGVALGGGDTDLAVATARNAGGKYNLYVSSLSLASITISRSEDGGQTFFTNPVSTAPLTIVDRQWIIADGANDLYLVFRDDLPMWYVRVSHDGGTTFGPTFPLIAPQYAPFAATPAGVGSRAGNLAFDRATKDLYLPFTNVASLQEARDGLPRHVVYMARWNSSMTVAENSVVYNGPTDERVDAIFPTTAVDDAGSVYAAWSTTKGVFFAASGDKGATWTAKTKVSQDPAKGTVQPWLAAGDAGRVGVAFLGGTLEDLDDVTNEWHAYYAMSLDGDCAIDASCTEPAFTQIEASDHVIHRGSVCLRGLSCDTTAPGDRSLAEVTAVQIDVDGMAVVSWPDSSRNPVFPRIAKQPGGPALRGNPLSVVKIESPNAGTFTATGALTLNFHGTPQPASLPDGTDVSVGAEGTMTTAAPADPHVALVGYPITKTPQSAPAAFESDAMPATAIGGPLQISLWLQGEGGQTGTGILEYKLIEVLSDGSRRTIASRTAAGNGTDVCCRFKPGVTAPAVSNLTFPAIPGAAIAAGSKLRLEMRFDVPQQSGVRFFYDSPSFPSRITLTTGTLS